MNMRAAHGLPAAALLELKGLRLTSSVTDRGALAILPGTAGEMKIAVAVVLISILAFAGALPFANVHCHKLRHSFRVTNRRLRSSIW
jgi:hypothetical protein